MLQEERRVDRAAEAPTGVLQIGHGTLDQLLHLGWQGHAPHRLSGGAGGGEQLPGERVVVAEEPRHPGTERHEDCAGQRRQIDHGSGLLLDRPGQHVCQDEPPLGVGVQHFHAGAVLADDYIARLVRGPAGQVLAGAEVGAHRERRLQRSDQPHCRDHRGRACHVRLHVLHALRGLQREAAGVERDGLSDQGHRLAAGASGLVRDADELRLFGAAPRDAEEQVHAQLRDLRSSEHLALEAQLFRNLPRLRGQRARSRVAGRLVHQVARGADRVGDLASEPRGVSEHAGRFAGDQQIDTGQLEGLLLLLVAVEGVGTERRAFRGRLDGIRAVERSGDRERLRAGCPRQLDRARRRGAELLQRPIAIFLLAYPDRRKALRPELAVRVQREDLAFLPGEVLFLGAAGEQRVQSTSGSNLAALAHEQGEEVRFVGSGLCGNDKSGKRHRSGAFYSGRRPAVKPSI